MQSKSNPAIVIAYAAVTMTLALMHCMGHLKQIFDNAGIRHDADLITTALIGVLGVVAYFLGAGAGPALIVGTTGSFITLTFAQEPFVRYLTFGALLFCLGLYGMVVSRNAVRVLMCIELMLNAVNINLVTFARYMDPDAIRGQIFAVFILTVAAAEAAVGLAIVLAIYRNMSTVDMEKFNLLKW